MHLLNFRKLEYTRREKVKLKGTICEQMSL